MKIKKMDDWYIYVNIDLSEVTEIMHWVITSIIDFIILNQVLINVHDSCMSDIKVDLSCKCHLFHNIYS